MIKDNNTLENHLRDFCKKHKIDLSIFEIARIGKGKGSTERKVLLGPTVVKNKNCTYVIKLFLEYDLIIIWNYKNNKSMSYSYVTIAKKLETGIFMADKGYGTHTNNQSIVLFERSENFDRLLNYITNRL
jgi:predicted nucleic acid-binding protein